MLLKYNQADNLIDTKSKKQTNNNTKNKLHFHQESFTYVDSSCMHSHSIVDILFHYSFFDTPESGIAESHTSTRQIDQL